LLVIKPSVLPCLQTLEPGKFGANDDYTQYSLNERLAFFQSENEESLGQLFLGFLRYFSHEFDYERSAISIRLGRVVNKAVVRAYRSPKNNPTFWTFLAVEEPFDRTNTASAVHDLAAFERILYIFRQSYQFLANGSDFRSICSLWNGILQ